MKEELIELVHRAPDAIQGRNLAREYLQSQILASLQRAGAMIPLAFHGGTALRFLYAHGRYSEDLDFALEQRSDLYDLPAYLQSIRRNLTPQGYTIDLKLDDSRAVHNAFVRFPGLPFELGISGQRNEILAVKIEVDTKPPGGAGLETTILRRHVLLNLQHHDRPSLLAGKLHAILQRPYLKGRDVYDLMWYLSTPDWPEPNLVMLNHALKQTGWKGGEIVEETWRLAVRERLETAQWEQVIADVRPFVETGGDAGYLRRETMQKLLG